MGRAASCAMAWVRVDVGCGGVGVVGVVVVVGGVSGDSGDGGGGCESSVWQ